MFYILFKECELANPQARSPAGLDRTLAFGILGWFFAGVTFPVL